MLKLIKNFPVFPHLLLISLVITSGCSKERASNDNEPQYHHVANIKTITPSNSYQVSRQYIGKVVSKQFSALSFEYSGKVINVVVDSGDIVNEGDLLAELDTELLKINQRELDAQISQLQAQARLNKLNLTRINQLNTKGYSSQQAIDELETEKAVIQADLTRKLANKATLAYQINKAKLYAPFNATISSRAVAEGEIFNAGQTAFELIKQAHHEVSVGVPVKVASKLTVGESIKVNIADQDYQALLLVIGKQINTISRTVELRLSLAQKTPFYNDQLATVSIDDNRSIKGFWVPLSALTDGIRGQWNIYLVTPEQGDLFTINASTVTVQYATLNAAYISGLEGIQHQIISTGVHRYVPGQQVKKDINLKQTTLSKGNEK